MLMKMRDYPTLHVDKIITSYNIFLKKFKSNLFTKTLHLIKYYNKTRIRY
jgi:hypothetical protein